MPLRGIIIFDLDDTLVDTSDLYWRTRSRFVALLRDAGFNARKAIRVFEAIDLKLMRQWGFSPYRYSNSMVATYRELSRSSGLHPKPQLLDEVRKCGEQLLRKTPRVLPGATELLEWASRRFTLALITRGDPSLQTKKITHAGLSKYFSCIRVVPSKTRDVFRDVVRKSPRSERWVIGDSISTDMRLGKQVGAQCILFEYRHRAYVWHYEKNAGSVGSFKRIRHLKDAISIIKHATSGERVQGRRGSERLHANVPNRCRRTAGNAAP
jgi:putative hydrolase of the HAD superfamily